MPRSCQSSLGSAPAGHQACGDAPDEAQKEEATAHPHMLDSRVQPFTDCLVQPIDGTERPTVVEAVTRAATGSEESLRHRAASGDGAAFRTLVDPHLAMLTAVCSKLSRSEADAADALQLALLNVWRSLGSFDNRSSLGTWMYRIAHHSACSTARQRQIERATDHVGHSRLHEVADAPSPGHDDTIADRGLLAEALGHLEADDLYLLLAIDLLGRPFAEVSHELGTPTGTLKSRASRARARLRHWIESNLEEGERP